MNPVTGTDTIISEFMKNSAEKIVISRNDFQGKDYYHIRTYVRGLRDGNKDKWLPTDKGIAVNYTTLGLLFQGMDKLREYVMGSKPVIPALASIVSTASIIESLDGGLPF